MKFFINEELDEADFIIKEAFKSGLAAEVFVFAVKAMKENPNLSIIEAMTIGYEEWIK
jgi:hypothetical protein